MPHPLSRRDFPRALFVTFTTALVALYTYDLLDASHWKTHPAYAGDALESLARIRLAAEQGFGTWLGTPLHRLGAPFETSWASYPQPDALIFWLGGQLSRSIGLMATAHVLTLVGHVLSALSFFLSARLLGHRPLIAACCALLFGLSHFSIFRGFTHFSFALTFLFPPMLVTAWWIGASRRLRLTPTLLLLGATGVAIVGASNPYHVFIFLQLLTGALIFQLFTHRRRENLLAGLGLLAATGASVLLWNLPTLWALVGSRAAAPLDRSYAGSELYALKLVELFVPPTSHHFPFFADFGRYYGGSTSLRGELYSAYIGIIPALALLLVTTAAFKKLIAGRAGLRPSHAPWIIWLVLFSGVGGLQAWLALTGFDYFRATNRYSIIIVALALFFLSSTFSRLIRPTSLGQRFFVGTLALAVTGLGLWDQIPPGIPRGVRDAAAQQIAQDRAFADFLEKNLPPGALVFQLPVVPFPEQPTVVHMTDYAHFRPFLFTETLRFSYGTLIGTAESNWARWISTLPPPDIIASLQAVGFHALYLNRSGFTDRGSALLTAFESAGHPAISATDSGPDHVIVRLDPAARPQRPDFRDPRLLQPWYRNSLEENAVPKIYAAKGWLGIETDRGNTWRWAGRDAVITLLNLGASARQVRFQFHFASNKSGRLTVEFQNRMLWSSDSDNQLTSSGEISLELAPGPTELTYRYEGPLNRPATGDNRRLGFKIQNPTARFVD